MNLFDATSSNRRVAEVLQPLSVLYWIYAGRLIICLAVYGSAVVWGDVLAGAVVAPETKLIGVVGLALGALITPIAYWLSHRRARPVGRRFLYAQAILDVLLATGVIHITGGATSPFVFLYIAVAAAYGLLLPARSAILVALASGAVYLLDIAIFRPEQMGLPLFLQVLVFTGVASATSAIGGKLRQVRQELHGVSGELRRLKLDTADILASVPTAVVTLDADGRLAYMNPEASKLLALDLPEWVGLPVLAELDSRSPELGEAVRHTMDTGLRIRNREAVVQPDRTPAAELEPEAMRASYADVDPDDPSSGTAVAISTTLLQGRDTPASLVVLVQDLTTVRQLESLRLRTGTLEAVAELSASLAHELKNPLASIRSAVEQLCDRSWADDDDQILGRLIVRESDRLDRILREFGDFARVDVAERQPIDVAELVHDAVSVAKQHPAAEGRARFEVEIGQETDGLWGDPELLHATLSNLLLNAIQVGDPDKPVNVRVVADALRPDLVPREASLRLPVRIRVIDDGPGIPEEDRDRIFDPFYTKREGGSGLGLSIAYRAVQAHGGVLMVKSEIGEGATFDIVLPRRAGERPPGLPGHPPVDAKSVERPVAAS